MKRLKPYSRAAEVRKVILGAMARNGVVSQTELGNRIGFGSSTVSKRFRGEPFWDLPELWKLDKALKFTDEEWLALCKCARK